MRYTPRRTLGAAFIFGLIVATAAADHALAQEPMLPPPIPHEYSVLNRPHRWYHFFLPNDDIPRTYSYYYSPWLNQPRHFRVVRPDGTTYWTSTVRGLPMGFQWLAH